MQGEKPALPYSLRQTRSGVDLRRQAYPYYNLAPNYERDTLPHWRRIVDDIPATVGVPQKQLFLVFTEGFGGEQAQIEWRSTVARGGRYSAAAAPFFLLDPSRRVLRNIGGGATPVDLRFDTDHRPYRYGLRCAITSPRTASAQSRMSSARAWAAP